MADAIRFTPVKLDSGGIAATLKGQYSGEVQSLAASLAERANSMAHLTRTEPDGPAYEGVVKELTYTPVGIVRTASHYGRIDQSVHHTLDKINH